MLKEGKLDFVATSMTRTPDRLKDIDFSYIYFVTPHAVIVRKSSGITSVHQLAGKKASSASTSTAGPNLKEAEPKVELVYVRDYALAFGLLKDGKVDAFPTDETVLRAIVQQDGHPDDYVFLSDFTKSRNVGFALKKDEPRFKDAINKALLDVEASGEAVKIFDAWFGPQSQEPMRANSKSKLTSIKPTETDRAIMHPVFVARSKAAQPIWFVTPSTFPRSSPSSTSAPAPM